MAPTLLESLLSLVKNEDLIIVNLYDENDLLLITFHLPGYQCLKDELLSREVNKLIIQSKSDVDITLNAPSD